MASARESRSFPRSTPFCTRVRRMLTDGSVCWTPRRSQQQPQRPPAATRNRHSTTSLLTAATLIYATEAGITAAAGTRLALCWLLDKLFTLFSFQLENPSGPLLLFLVTTSRCPDWVICAPAAFLGCGSRFSGSLSGVPHPRSVTRHNHGKTIPYHPKLIGQKFERCVAHSAIRKEIVNHQILVCISNLYHDKSRLVARISSRITTVIRVELPSKKL